ncbi:PCNA-associated factor-like [Anoplophora glabripennis]|uniref:PCNA-associated factor-like n=1 Tax=Anoplophora glabripennis TaxID=217634 RepID=UPI000873BC19|nr:PCNA-associated factor-like [Anoplophora glabripennis]
MVRTSGGIRISAGKSSKKSGGGGTSSGGSRSTSTPSGKSSGSNRLPPIPHCEAPSWQKPITNFFISDAGSSKNGDAEIGSNEEDAGYSSKNTDEIVEKSEIREKDSNKIEDEQLPEKSGKQEEKGKENEDSNISS